jgi:polyhydroxybutyrate depolymerase
LLFVPVIKAAFRIFFISGTVALLAIFCRAPEESLEKRIIEVNGEQRAFWLVPPSLTFFKNPLVILLHGAGSDGRSFAMQTKFSAIAGRYGFIALYPDALKSGPKKISTWNAGECCSQDNQAHDDVSYINALITHAGRVYDTDPDQVFLVGYSNGAMLAYRLACQPDATIKAVAIVAGSRMVDCHPRPDLPLLVIHGTNDRKVPYQGGPGPESLFRTSKKSVHDSLAPFAGLKECHVAVADADYVLHRQFCRYRESQIELYTIVMGQHEWPPHGEPGRPGVLSPASELIGEFIYDRLER